MSVPETPTTPPEPTEAVPAPAAPIHAGRLWAFATAGAIVAGLATYIALEATPTAFIPPPNMVRVMGQLVNQPKLADVNVADRKNAMIAYGVAAGTLGLALGLAGGAARRSTAGRARRRPGRPGPRRGDRGRHGRSCAAHLSEELRRQPGVGQPGDGLPAARPCGDLGSHRRGRGGWPGDRGRGAVADGLGRRRRIGRRGDRRGAL